MFSAIYTEIRRSLSISLPLVASELMYGICGFITTIFVAHLGPKELAASGLVWGVYITVIIFFIGILSATGILTAQSYGANDPHGIRSSTQQGLILAVLSAIPMMLILLLAPKILTVTGQDPEIIHLATPYFHALTWTVLPLNLFIVMEQFLLGIAKPKLVLLISLLNVPLETSFFYILIFGKFGVPKLGLSGIGYGFTITFTIALIYTSLYLYFSKQCRHYAIFSKWHFNQTFFRELLRIGLPMGSMFCIELSLFAALSFMMGRLSSELLAAHQIANQCMVLVNTIIFGLCQGIAIRISHEVGCNNKASIKLTARVNLGIGLFLITSIAAYYLCCPKTIIALDINIHDPQYQQLIKHAITFLTIAAFLQIMDCVRLISVATLRGLKDTQFPMYLSIVTFWLVTFPCAYIFSFMVPLGGKGIWYSLLLGISLSAIILHNRFNKLIDKINLAAILTR